MPKKPKKRSYRYPDKTTIWISKSTQEELKKLFKGGDDYDSVISRVLSGEGEVYVEVLGVDGDIPMKHEVIFKLGNYLYRYNHGNFEPLKEGQVKVIA